MTNKKRIPVVLFLIYMVSSMVIIAENLLTNNGFEQLIDGRPVGWSNWEEYSTTEINVDQEISFMGSNSMHVEVSEGSKSGLRQSVKNLIGGTTYYFSCWARGPISSAHPSLGILIAWHSTPDSGGYISENPKWFRDTGTQYGVWKKYTWEVTAPENAVRAYLIVRFNTPGEVWFDEVYFGEAPPSSLSATLPQRDFVLGKEPIYIDMEFFNFEESECPLSVSVFQGDEEISRKQIAALPVGKSNISMELPSLLKPGTYRVVIKETGKKGELLATEIILKDKLESLVLINPNFDDQLNGWSLNHREVSHYDAHVGRTAPGSIRLESSYLNPYAAQKVLNIEPEGTYELSAWIKGLKGNNSRGAIKIEWYDLNGQHISGKYEHLNTNGEEKWQQINFTLKAEPESTQAIIYLRIYENGPVWFDDVSFSKVESSPPFVMKDLPIYTCKEQGRTHPISLIVADKVEQLMLSIIREDDMIIDTWTVDNPYRELYVDGFFKHTWEVEFPTSVQEGIFQLELCLPEINLYYKRRLKLLLAPEISRKPDYLTDDGAYLVDGKPFFPIGLYHVVPGFGVSSTLGADYALVAEYGFNAVQSPSSLDPNALDNACSLAQQNGLMLDMGLYCDVDIKRSLEIYKSIIKQLKGHPSILTWKIIDEPNNRGANLKIDVPKAYWAYKKLDSDTPIMLTIAPTTEENYAFWSNFCDVFQVDPYPLPNLPLTFVSDNISKVKSVLRPWQNVTAVLQCGWKQEEGNQPTVDQARSMMYLSIINGAKGIFWYTFRDPNWNLPETPLWSYFKQINAETAYLGNIAINGIPHETIKNITGEVQYAAWWYNKNLYIAIANSGNKASNVEIQVENGLLYNEQLYAKTTPRLEKNVLRDNLPPISSCIYVLQPER